MRFRVCGALLAAVLAVATLAGCKTNVGAAASVDGTTISESDVNDQIVPGQGSVVAFGSSRVPAKTFVLQALVQQRLLERTLAENGGVPADGELNALSGKASELLLNAPASAVTSFIQPALRKGGVKPSFANRFLRVTELQYVLIQRKNITRFSNPEATIERSLTATLQSRGQQVPAAQVRQVAVATAGLIERAPSTLSLEQAVTSALGTVLQVPSSQQDQLKVFVDPIVSALTADQFSGVGKLVRASHLAVSVSPRYGTWDTTNLTVKYEGNEGVPGFLTIRPTPSGSSSGR